MIEVGQMSIFDLEDREEIFQPLEPMCKVGDKVRVKTSSELLNPDIETVGYLEDYGFGGQTGTIKRVQVGVNICYYISTKLGTAVVREEELAFIS